jgi:lipopolysaccharide transport system ATP-binding protein
MKDIAIRAENLSKCYRLGVREGVPDTFVGQALSWFKQPLSNFQRLRKLSRFDDEDSPDILWALREVNFEIGRGEVVGFIGRNGAGKSTLLKILSRITQPTSGSVEIFGRVSSLLEVGTGFHPELTGRENIYLNGTILGMRKREIDRKFDEIVEFAGVSKFIDTPVKRYSSGMSVRLAFAVAAHLEPEILIVDEVLAVGDAQFQQKSIGKMQEVARGEGRTVLFVSHNMAAVENLCQKAIVMEQGRVAHIGDVRSGVREYLRRNNQYTRVDLLNVQRRGNGCLWMTWFRMLDEEGHATEFAQSGRDITFAVGYHCPYPELTSHVDVGFGIHNATGETLGVVYASQTGRDFGHIPPDGVFRATFKRLPLAPGRYLIHAIIYVNDAEADFPQQPIAVLDVEGGDFYGTGRLSKHRGPAPLLLQAAFGLDEGKVDPESEPTPPPRDWAQIAG